MVLGVFSARTQARNVVLRMRAREGSRFALVSECILIQLSPAVLLSASASPEEKRDEEINQSFGRFGGVWKTKP